VERPSITFQRLPPKTLQLNLDPSIQSEGIDCKNLLLGTEFPLEKIQKPTKLSLSLMTQNVKARKGRIYSYRSAGAMPQKPQIELHTFNLLLSMIEIVSH